MALKGQRKFVCLDCGATRHLWIDRARFHSQTKKEHCRECGSTFLEPCSVQAKGDTQERNIRANDNCEGRGDVVRAKPGRRY